MPANAAVAKGEYELKADTSGAQRENRALGDSLKALQAAALATAAAVAGVGLGIAKIITSTADYNVNLLRTSQILGTTTEYLSAQSHALTQSGIELDDFTDAAVTMAERMKEAEQETGTLFEFAPQLGLDLERLGRLTPIEALEEFGEAIRKTRDPTLRMAAASEVLGDVGFRLIPFFEQGRERIAEFRAEAAELGITVSESQARASEAFQRSWGRITALLTSVRNEIGSALIPIVEQYLNQFSDWFKENRETISEAIQRFVTLFATLAQQVPRAFQWLSDNRETIIGVITAIAGAWAAVRVAAVGASLAQLAASNPKVALGTGLLGGILFSASQIGSSLRDTPGLSELADAIGIPDVPGPRDLAGRFARLIQGGLEDLGGLATGGVGDLLAGIGGLTPVRPGGYQGIPYTPGGGIVRPPPPTTVTVNIAPGGDLVTTDEGGLRGAIENGVRSAIGAGFLQSGIIPPGCVATAVNR